MAILLTILALAMAVLTIALCKASSAASRREEQAEGIAAAKARGVHLGRKADPLPPNFEAVFKRWQNGDITGADAARQCCMPYSTWKNKAKAWEKRRESDEQAAFSNIPDV